MGVGERLDTFNDLFLTCLDQHTPLKTIKLKHKLHPCVSGEIKQRIIAGNKLHKKARRSKCPDDWSAFKALRNEVKNLIRMAEIEWFNYDINVNKGGAGSISKVIRKALSNKPN